MIVFYPEIGTLSNKVKNVRSLLINKLQFLYYRLEHNEIAILNMYDTRMNAHKNPYQ